MIKCFEVHTETPERLQCKGASRNKTAVKAIGEGNELEKWVSGVSPWKSFVTIPFDLASNAIKIISTNLIKLFNDILWLLLHMPSFQIHIAYF